MNTTSQKMILFVAQMLALVIVWTVALYYFAPRVPLPAPHPGESNYEYLNRTGHMKP